MKITVATLLFGQLSYFRYTEAINRRYCELHGYGFEIIRPQTQIQRSPIWFKVKGVLDLLSNSDYVLFLDADAYFINASRSIQMLVMEHMDDAAILLGTDRRDKTFAWSDVDANCGVFVVRHCPQAFDMLTTWWNSPLADTKWLWAWPPEQGAFNRHIRVGLHSHWVKVIYYAYMNGTDGSFIRHLIGYSDEQRLALLRQECQQSEV